MKNHSLLNFIVFVCALTLGYTFSNRLFGLGSSFSSSAIKIVSAKNQAPIAEMSNGQRSILLITTSSIHASHPHLASIWMASYFTSDANIRLLPIYPSGEMQVSGFEEQLNRLFAINKKNGVLTVNQEFLDLLKSENYWWSGYVIVDEDGVAKIIDYFGGLEISGSSLSSGQAVYDISRSKDDPIQAYSSQVAIWQSACNKLSQISSTRASSQLFSFISDQVISNLDKNQLQAEIQILYSSHHQLTCSFPKLEISHASH